MHVIGIDNGNGDTKTRNTIFHSGVRQLTEDSLSPNIIEIDCERYALGENVPEYNSRKYENKLMYIQTLASIALELEARNIHEDVPEIWLAIGLPIGHWGNQKDKVKEYMLQKDEVSFVLNGKPYVLRIKGCNIMPQGLASTRSYRPKEKGNIITLDIGNGTLDYLTFHDGVIAEKECGSEEYGIAKCYELVKRSVMNRYSTDIDYYSFENYIKNERATLNHKWSGTIDEAIKEYCKGVMHIAKRIGYNANTCSLHIMGGGAYVVRQYAVLDDKKVTWDMDVHSNAKGYESFCKQNLRKQGVDFYD